MTSQLPDDDQWEPALYDDKHSFVWKLGASVIELLGPKSGERILDLGCGTGQLTAQIAETGATVVGLDNSPAMIDEARRLYPDLDFQLGDAHDFEFDEPFDGVFSNAALHWTTEPNKVVNCIGQSLKSSGRMAVEFGGHGNVRHLAHAIESACEVLTGTRLRHPWYFPSIVKFGTVLEQHGLEVTQAAMIDRPTPLEGDEGLRNWVRMFGQHWLTQVSPEQHEDFFVEVEKAAQPNLLRDSVWHADYRRIRIEARKI